MSPNYRLHDTDTKKYTGGKGLAKAFADYQNSNSKVLITE